MTQPHLDTCLKLIADGHRRGVIQKLRHGASSETTVSDLVDQLQQGDVAVNDTNQDRDALSAQLMHNHLPRLAEHGIVEYDRDRNTVRYQSPERIETVLDALPQDAPQSNT